MSVVNLIFPVWVTVQIWDVTKQTMDVAAREPIHGARATVGGALVKIQAQVGWIKRGLPQYQAAGVVPKSAGHILVRRSDMRAKNIALKRGDKIIAIGSGLNATTGLALYITDEVPEGHTDGGSKLARFNFEDRFPGATP